MSTLLIHELIELQRKFHKKEIPLILGGGMSLFIRSWFLNSQQSSRYPFLIEARSTNDLDLFMSSEVIISKAHFENMKEIFNNLGYEVNPEAKYFQFVKEVDVKGSVQDVGVDLLAAPPKDESKVDIKTPRVRPKGVSQIHAYLTQEAAGLDIGLVPVTSAQLPSLAGSFEGEFYLLSCFNYIILKLHAFFDRKDRKDSKSDEGRHHAHDIFATVCRMSEEDWKVAENHKKKHAKQEYLERAKQIQRGYFSSVNSLGILRIQENESFKRDRAQYTPYLQQFVGDLNDLFT